jgi:hypothetical protein
MSVSGAAIFSEQLTATSPSTLFKEGFIVKATTTGGGGSQPAYTYYTAAGSKRWSSFLNVGDDKLHIANALNSEVFTIIQSGSVGIGTSSPTEKLDVIGGALAAGNGTIRTGITYSTLGLMGTFTNHDLGILTNGGQRITITNGGVVRINGFTSAGLVGTDASGNLGVVNSTYTEIATGTITYSSIAGYSWGINNSFPGNIRNYTDDGIAGTTGADAGSNENRGVTFDLGSSKAVRRIVERGYNTKCLNSITVQFSSDNSNWSTIFVYPHIYNNTEKVMDFNPTGAVSARYWRWYISSWTQREETNYYTYEAIIYT